MSRFLTQTTILLLVVLCVGFFFMPFLMEHTMHKKSQEIPLPLAFPNGLNQGRSNKETQLLETIQKEVEELRENMQTMKVDDSSLRDITKLLLDETKSLKEESENIRKQIDTVSKQLDDSSKEEKLRMEEIVNLQKEVRRQSDTKQDQPEHHQIQSRVEQKLVRAEAPKRTPPPPSPNNEKQTVKAANLQTQKVDKFNVVKVKAVASLSDPNQGDPEFENMIKKHAINNTIIISISNYAWVSFMSNWRCSVEALGITNYITIAMDQQIHQKSLELGIHSYLPPNVDSAVIANYGTAGFKNLVKVKSAFVLTALKLGYNVLLSDTDIVFLKNPLPYLTSMGPKWDLLIQSDSSSKNEDYMKMGSKVFLFNSGFYFARSNERTITFFTKWVETEAQKVRLTEQEVLNSLVKRSQNFPISFRILKRELFPNGSVFFKATGTVRRKPGAKVQSKAKSPAAARVPANRHLLALNEDNEEKEVNLKIEDKNDVIASMNETAIAIETKERLVEAENEKAAEESILSEIDFKYFGDPIGDDDVSSLIEVEPYIVHANWMVGAEMKRTHLMDAQFWVIDDDLKCVSKFPTNQKMMVKFETDKKREAFIAFSNLVKVYGNVVVEKMGIYDKDQTKEFTKETNKKE